MVVVVPEDEIERHPITGRVLRGGFFGVPRRQGKQKLIHDHFPMNELEADLSPVLLALLSTGADFARCS